MSEPLTEAELDIASKAYALEGKSLVPTDDYAPVCEALVERGWLDRWQTEVDGEQVTAYNLTTAARGAMDLGGLLELQPEQQN
jgi:hypothetical protein